jgi:uncharacterized membrane protein HdeD (DUF308 family)
MSSSAKSVYYFGFYLLILGVTLIAFPNLLLSTFQLPETSEVWIKVAGALVINIGLYYVFMAPSNNSLFLTLTVYTRAAILVWFIVFVLLDWAPSMLIPFGVVDMAGALWTYLELKKQK